MGNSRSRKLARAVGSEAYFIYASGHLCYLWPTRNNCEVFGLSGFQDESFLA